MQILRLPEKSPIPWLLVLRAGSPDQAAIKLSHSWFLIWVFLVIIKCLRWLTQKDGHQPKFQPRWSKDLIVDRDVLPWKIKPNQVQQLWWHLGTGAGHLPKFSNISLPKVRNAFKYLFTSNPSFFSLQIEYQCEVLAQLLSWMWLWSLG